jgi:hypothetical protein
MAMVRANGYTTHVINSSEHDSHVKVGKYEAVFRKMASRL